MAIYSHKEVDAPGAIGARSRTRSHFDVNAERRNPSGVAAIPRAGEEGSIDKVHSSRHPGKTYTSRP